MKKIILPLLICLVMLVPVVSKADVPTIQPSQDELKQELITLIQQLIAQLQQQIVLLTSQQSTSQSSVSLSSPLVNEPKNPVSASQVQPICTLLVQKEFNSNNVPVARVTWTSSNATSAILYSSAVSEVWDGKQLILGKVGSLNSLDSGTQTGLKLNNGNNDFKVTFSNDAYSTDCFASIQLNDNN